MDEPQTSATETHIPFVLTWIQEHSGIPPIVTMVGTSLLAIFLLLGILRLIGKVSNSRKEKKLQKEAEKLYESWTSNIVDAALSEEAEFDAERDTLRLFKQDWETVSNALRERLHSVDPYRKVYSDKRQEWDSPELRAKFLLAYRRPLAILLDPVELRETLDSAGLVFEDDGYLVSPRLHTVTLCDTGLKAVFHSDASLSLKRWRRGADVLRRALDAPNLTLRRSEKDMCVIEVLLNDQDQRTVASP